MIFDFQVHKDDHDRERTRWQQKLDEAEGRLAEAAVSNADMLQAKAELVGLKAKTAKKLISCDPCVR